MTDYPKWQKIDVDFEVEMLFKTLVQQKYAKTYKVSINRERFSPRVVRVVLTPASKRKPGVHEIHIDRKVFARLSDEARSKVATNTLDFHVV